MNEVHRCPRRPAERTHHLVELHDRIRELEAELAEEHRQNIRNLARAEKAEARVAGLEEHLAGRDGFHEYGGECYEFVAENPPEREADQD